MCGATHPPLWKTSVAIFFKWSSPFLFEPEDETNQNSEKICFSLGVRTCKTLTSNVKQRKRRRQNSRTKKKQQKVRGKEKVPRFLHRSLSTQMYFRSSLFLLPGGEKGRPEIHLHSQATYTEVNLKNSYLMYVCRQLLNHPEGESEGLSLNQDLFLRIAHPKSRGGRGEVNVRNLLRPWCVFYIPQSQNN